MSDRDAMRDPMNDAEGLSGPDAEVERALASLRPAVSGGAGRRLVERDALLYWAGYEAAARQQRARAARWRGIGVLGWAAAAGLAIAMLVRTDGAVTPGGGGTGVPTIVRDAEASLPAVESDRPALSASPSAGTIAKVPFHEGPASLLLAGLFVDRLPVATGPTATAAQRSEPPLVAQLRLERALGVPAEQWGAGARMIAPRY